MIQHDTQIIVTIDLDVPEDRVYGAELELVEQHLGDLLKEALLIEEAQE